MSNAELRSRKTSAINKLKKRFERCC